MTDSSILKIKDLSSILGVSTHLLYKIVKENSIDSISEGNKKVLPPSSVRKIMELRGFRYSPKNKPLIINVFGMKGGIGKTSIATALAEGASRLGFRVLAVDLDMQANLTQSFRMKKKSQHVLRHVIDEDADISISEAICNVHPFLDLIPSSLENSKVEIILSQKTIDFIGYFNQLFRGVFQNYDLIVLDCPPSVNKITTCATCFSDINLIPVNADTDSFDGVSMSVSEIKRLEKMFEDRDLKIDYKILFNKYDAREKLSFQVMGYIGQENDLAEHLLPIVIRTDTAFKNTKADGGHIFDLQKSSGREDCISLITEITGINKWIEEKSASNKGAAAQQPTMEENTVEA